MKCVSISFFILVLLVSGCTQTEKIKSIGDDVNLLEEENDNITQNVATEDTISYEENDATIYCIDAGGKIEMRKGKEGETEFCILEDGTECEAWDYYNGYCNVKKDDEKSSTTESWIKDSTKLVSDTTSSSSIVLQDGTLRMYRTDDGAGIYYSESKDGKTFSALVKTNIDGDVSNPAIVYVENRYILFYNKESGNYHEGSGIDQLWRAESDDGKTFSVGEKVADVLIDSKAVVGVPDIILLADGSLRVYGTQGHSSSTARSTDLGKTWVTDGNDIFSGACADPDVYIEGAKFYMYYTDTVIAEECDGFSKDKIRENGCETNVINKAISSDGITWEIVSKNVITPYPEEPKQGVVMDADYIKMLDGTEIIYFGQGKLNDKGLEYTHIFRAVKE